MFDTHCHLNFKIFEKSYPEVIERAKQSGVNCIIIPGTNLISSRQAIQIAEQFPQVYATIGIHPHHAQEFRKKNGHLEMEKKIQEIETLLKCPKVVGIGEVGMDKHIYKKTKYEEYLIDKQFVNLQGELFEYQIDMAIAYEKALIVHNREAKKDVLDLLKYLWDERLRGRVVFHCCEPDNELLSFAKKYDIFIGVDGDVTYDQEKEIFIKKAPLELLVLETDSPYLLPRLQRQQVCLHGGQEGLLHFPNEPKNISIIAEYIAKLKNTSIKRLIEVTTKNAKKLFQLDKQ